MRLMSRTTTCFDNAELEAWRYIQPGPPGVVVTEVVLGYTRP
jgi:hypothetical protein